MESRWRDPLLLASTCAGLAGLGWLLPLMFDQMTFFGDQEQISVARRSMTLMIPAGGLVLMSAAGLWARLGAWHGLLAALPALISVPLAWALPDLLLQLLSYGLCAPLALGSMLSALFPRSGAMPRPAHLLAAVGLVLLTVAVTPFLAFVSLLTGLVWWLLPAQR